MTIKIGGNGRDDASMSAIKKAVDSNQLRLQTLELAVAHLTNICIGLTEEIGSLRSALLESNAIRGVDEQAVIDMKLSYYSNSTSPCSDSNYDVSIKKVGRQTAHKLSALPQKKDVKANPATKVQGSKPQTTTVKANPKSSMKAAATTSQKGSTGSTKAILISNMKTTKRNPSTVKSSARAIPATTARAEASAHGSTKLKMNTKSISETTKHEGLKKSGNNSAASSVPVKGGRKASESGAVTVKLPPQMADAPTIRSLIYGSRTISVVKSNSRGQSVPIIHKKRT